MEAKSNIHQFKIEEGKISLDSFTIKGLINYKVEKSSDDSPTELTVTLLIKDINNLS